MTTRCFPIMTLVKGSEEIDLVRVHSQSAMASVSGGFGTSVIIPQYGDRRIAGLDELTFTENYRIILKENSADEIATQSRKLWEMLRYAWLYNNKPDRYDEPVYLLTRARGETNDRKSLVWGSPQIIGQFPVFNQAFEQALALDDVGIEIRRFAWKDFAQGVLPDPLDLTATNGPANPIVAWISNHYDDNAIDQVKVDDGGAFTDRFGTAAFDLFPAAAVTDDRLYIGSDEPFFHFAGFIGTPGVYTSTTFAYEYWNGGWQALALGDDFTLYPDDDPFDATGHWGFNWKGADDWQKTGIDGDNKFWIRIVVTMGGVWTTSPANAVYAIYNQRTPQIRIPAASLEGDSPPTMLFRLKQSYGGDGDVYFSNNSRIIVGAKSRHTDEFNSHLNCGNDGLPAGWGVTYDNDTSSETSEIAPGGDRAICDFSTDTTMALRVRFTGTNMLDVYRGKYLPYLRVTQVLGDVGDCNVKLRIRVAGINDYDTLWDGPSIQLEGASDVGGEMEIVNLNPQQTISIPLHTTKLADEFENAELYFEIWAERTTGSSELRFYDLILIPADEWVCEMDDPITEAEDDPSALRGETGLDLDGGVIADRTMKFIVDLTNDELVPAEPWSRHGYPPRLDPYEGDTYLYFLFAHYPEGEDFGDNPLCGRLGMSLFTEIYSHNIYHYLRGDD